MHIRQGAPNNSYTDRTTISSSKYQVPGIVCPTTTDLVAGRCRGSGHTSPVCGGDLVISSYLVRLLLSFWRRNPYFSQQY